LNFLFDNNLPLRLARAISALDGSESTAIVHLRDRFPADTKDTQWIAELGTEGGWVIVSADQRIFRNKHEREAWRSSGMTAFFLAKGWGNQQFWEQAWRLVRWWPRITEIAESPVKNSERSDFPA